MAMLLDGQCGAGARRRRGLEARRWATGPRCGLLAVHTIADFSGLEPEAAWTPEGAACVARPRLVTSTLEEIVAECPERFGVGSEPKLSAT
jgi:hypothetical protein